MEIVLLTFNLLIFLVLIVLVFVVIRRGKESKELEKDIENRMKRLLEESLKLNENIYDTKLYLNNKISEIDKGINLKIDNQMGSFSETIGKLSSEISKYINLFSESFFLKSENQNNKIVEAIKVNFFDLVERYKLLNESTEKYQKDILETVEKQLSTLAKGNSEKLNEIRSIVDDKLHATLEKRLGESFNIVSSRLEQVHKGLGEMQTLARGVGDLKKVLSGVKTRGILGELQLGAILEQIFSPDQYISNCKIDPLSGNSVEFAIVMPGHDEKSVLLPIDSKFPLDKYNLLLEAREVGDKEEIESRYKELISSIYNSAKDISSKYIHPPHSTDFAIMFLPVESLYGEVLSIPGVVEDLQKRFKISITGPTTLTAFLNSLRMGFKTVAVQKRSSEVWELLSAVKSEFLKFTDILDKAYRQLNSAEKTLDSLRSTRVNQINRKLRSVESLESEKVELILGDDNGEV
ncbi:MAG: DNA recombination protein RmuC [Candidatus Cloacimonadota bacterium]|nr:MAG: DNA recombination protein RmuC [Candidatus Cloacimonadota bacterium]PIE81646.1 MAG: DNA recombination protein RmuC [Candidatus Delongbacteria bacterium]